MCLFVLPESSPTLPRFVCLFYQIHGPTGSNFLCEGSARHRFASLLGTGFLCERSAGHIFMV